MDTQLIIWLVITALLLVARFTSVTYTREVFPGLGYRAHYWKGDWIRGLPLLWLVISALVYLIKFIPGA